MRSKGPLPGRFGNSESHSDAVVCMCCACLDSPHKMLHCRLAEKSHSLGFRSLDQSRIERDQENRFALGEFQIGCVIDGEFVPAGPTAEHGPHSGWRQPGWEAKRVTGGSSGSPPR